MIGQRGCTLWLWLLDWMIVLLVRKTESLPNDLLWLRSPFWACFHVWPRGLRKLAWHSPRMVYFIYLFIFCSKNLGGDDMANCHWKSWTKDPRAERLWMFLIKLISNSFFCHFFLLYPLKVMSFPCRVQVLVPVWGNSEGFFQLQSIL